jgi:hypothetical protein
MRPLARAARTRRRIGARDHDDVDALGHLFESLREARALLRRRVGLVEVVEDDDARRAATREEIAEEAADEAREVLLGSDVKCGSDAALARELLRGDAQVVQERRVSASPASTGTRGDAAARLEIARDERGLARARRAAQPDDRPRRASSSSAKSAAAAARRTAWAGSAWRGRGGVPRRRA